MLLCNSAVGHKYGTSIAWVRPIPTPAIRDEGKRNSYPYHKVPNRKPPSIILQHIANTSINYRTHSTLPAPSITTQVLVLEYSTLPYSCRNLHRSVRLCLASATPKSIIHPALKLQPVCLLAPRCMLYIDWLNVVSSRVNHCFYHCLNHRHPHASFSRMWYCQYDNLFPIPTLTPRCRYIIHEVLYSYYPYPPSPPQNKRRRGGGGGEHSQYRKYRYYPRASNPSLSPQHKPGE